MRRSTHIGTLFAICTLVALGTPTEGYAGDFGFSLGQDIGIIDVMGGESIANTGTRIGYRTNQLHLYGTLDYIRLGTSSKFKTQTTDDMGETTTNIQETDSHIGLATVGGGARYFFRNPGDAKQTTIPYLNGTVYTAIPFGEVDETGIAEDVSYYSFGFLAGFGADYFFTDQFSIGGELGLSGFFAHIEPDNSEDSFDGNALQLYSGIEFTFYL